MPVKEHLQHKQELVAEVGDDDEGGEHEADEAVGDEVETAMVMASPMSWNFWIKQMPPIPA